MRLILPILLALFGAAAGTGAGILLKPEVDTPEIEAGSSHDQVANFGADHGNLPEATGKSPDASGDHAAENHDTEIGNSEFTKLNNQFVIPVLHEGRVRSMVVLSLSLETPLGKRELIYSQEPRIRDAFLQILFDHANIGGFDGAFTSGDNMDVLRGELKRSGRKLLGGDILDVLVTDIARQDMG